eukprot:CAMPEP_0182420730 /NCGR_PEP_ID=MMETSP1167-20130531/5763_1 /TAXON_ID=2988 /ORGANISM="Mallomonas Sp, Strain CCMP3275" /LENGTH=380 /DNA_ID=CAMNT_0024597103 /DNA_START=25 /DNA_END=1171 /DNA_ORIENTATION=-
MAVIGSQELVSLMRILNDDGQSLEKAEAVFNKSFMKTDHFKVGCALCILIQDQLLTRTQRIIAFSILFNLYRSEQNDINPFLPFFHDAVEYGTDICEKRFIVQLLFTPSTTQENFKKLVPDILNELDNSDAEIPDSTTLRQLHNAQTPRPYGLSASGIRPVLPAAILSSTSSSEGEVLQLLHLEHLIGTDSNHTQSDSLSLSLPPLSLSLSPWSEEEMKLEAELFDMSLDPLSPSLSLSPTLLDDGFLVDLQPVFARPPPPMLEVGEGELQWINIDDAPCIVWDTSISQDDSRTSQVRDLMAAALAGPLNPTQQQQVISEFKADPKLVYHCALTPQKLPDLVENNPMIAIECLLKLMGSNQMTEYLSALVSMDMSLILWK